MVLWNEKIPFIKKMKEFYSKMNYKEINLWPIMANDLYTYYSNKSIGKRERFLIVLKCLFRKDIFKVKGGKNKIFVTYFMPRKDHHVLVQKSIEKFQKREITLMDAYEYKKRDPLKKGTLRAPDFFLFFRLWNEFRKSNLKEILGKYYFIILGRTYLRHKEINQFYKIYKKYLPKAHLAFCSQAFAEEAIFASICKKEKIPTFTLQHGLIVEYPYFHAASLLNENIISDYNLIWGKTTYDLLKKFTDPSRLLIVGNPKFSSIVKNNTKSFDPKKCVVFFPVPVENTSTNENIVKTINEFAKNHPKISFEPSVHPFDSLENYKKIMDAKNVNFVDSDIPIIKRIEESDFIILHNTTIAMEALRYGKPIFRFNDKFLVNLWENDDKFKDLKELEKLFKKFGNKKNFEKYKRFYAKEFENNFKIVPGKNTSQIYYVEIMKQIDAFNHKNP